MDARHDAEPAVEARFRLLGPVEIGHPSRPVRVPPGRPRAVLMRLLLEPNRVVSVDRLIGAVWDGDPPSTASNQVRICVSKLRRAFADTGEPGPIRTGEAGYLARLGAGETDQQLFADRVARGAVLCRQGRLADSARAVRSALTLWRGPALGGEVVVGGLRSWVTRLEERRLSAFETWVDLKLRLGEHDDVIDEAAELVDRYPLRERLRAQLMTALFRAGRRADALTAFDRGRATLAEELGLDPGAALCAVQRAILADPPERQRPASARRTLRPRQLPALTGDLVGRAAVVADLCGYLAAPASAGRPRVAVVGGMPGAGTSVLALSVAHRLSGHRFSDGTLYADLCGPAGGPEDALVGFLDALGVAAHDVPDSPRRRLDLYRSITGDRRILVVLDNACAQSQVLPLLPTGPDSAVIVAGASRLIGACAGRVVELDPLSQHDAVELLGRAAGAARVAAEPDAARELVELVGRLPLAVRAVGTGIAARPYRMLADVVGHVRTGTAGLDALAGGGGPTVGGSFTRAYAGLPAPARRLVRLLGLVGAVDVPAWLPQALVRGEPCGDTGTAPPIDDLIDHRLVDVVGAEPAGTRYRVHELVLCFGREQAIAERVRRSGGARSGTRPVRTGRWRRVRIRPGRFSAPVGGS